MKSSGKFSIVSLVAACLLAAAPGISYADCSFPDLDTFGSCVATAAQSCATDVDNCSLSKDINATTNTTIVEAALTKCCKLKTKKTQKACLVEQRANIRREQILLPSFLPSVRTLLGRSQAELGELIAEPNVCATFSVQ